MSRPNAFIAQFPEPAPDAPRGYAAQEVPYGEAAGGKQLHVRLYEIPPGENLCPYHYEYSEEWLIVMTGDIQVRTPAGTEPATAGDVICFPVGPDGAHKVFNSSEASARVVMFSNASDPEVCVYPDSDKVGVWAGDKRDHSNHWMFRGATGNLEYFDGEL
jgi:uncharacterized cupin superfamily protein